MLHLQIAESQSEENEAERQNTQGETNDEENSEHDNQPTSSGLSAFPLFFNAQSMISGGENML